MLDRQQHFIAEYDWMRTALMFEPRGHAMMSGSILYPSKREDCDIGVLFIETSGCLPMCGHGTIGTVTIAVENRLVHPRVPGRLDLETPAGRVQVSYHEENGKVRSVRLTNVPSFLHSRGLEVDCPELGGPLRFDVAYGGNFYAIIEPQAGYTDLEQLSAADIVRLSPLLRQRINARYRFSHPDDARLAHMRHIIGRGAAAPAHAPTRYSMATRRSTAHRQHRHFAHGPVGRARRVGGRRGVRARELHRQPVQRPRRGPGAGR
jgi:4-hydroxyproline epimerase